MTPKEKAEDLFKKYRPYADGIIVADIVNATKQCALIAVDEMIKELRANAAQSTSWEFLEEVKQEINKL